MENKQSKGVFINGKQQMIDLLKHLQGAEKEKLIRNITLRNPTLAKELMVNSLSFENIFNFSDEQIVMVGKYVNAAIWGLALKGCNQNFQRRVLSLINRDLAEQAYQILVKNIPNEVRDSQRAKNKVLQIMISLSNRGVLKVN